ncbi:MAG: hypothetical protein AAGC63_16675, partial [Propionicimonas sp.]
RQVAAALSAGLDPDAAAATGRLAAEVERARFAPAVEPGTAVKDWLERAASGVRAGRGAAHPLRRIFPRSVLRLPR